MKQTVFVLSIKKLDGEWEVIELLDYREIKQIEKEVSSDNQSFQPCLNLSQNSNPRT